MSVREAPDFRHATVIICGINAVGMACAANLCLANLGKLVLIDGRQALKEESSLFSFGKDGRQKRDLAAIEDILLQLNSGTEVCIVQEVLDAHNIEALLGTADVIVEACPDQHSKFLLSDSCMRLRKPLVYTALLDYSLQVYTMVPGRSACLRCLFAFTGREDYAAGQSLPASFISLAGLAGSMQAGEVAKLISRRGSLLDTKLVSFDILRAEFDYTPGLVARADCPDCGGP